jgi:protein TonB
VQASPAVKVTPVAKLGGTVAEPKVISHPAPVVPPLSVLRGIYGDVVLEATIDPAGQVAELRVVRGHPILAEAAKAAVMKWRYQPGTLNGQPIATKVWVQVSFQNRK